MFQDSTCFQTKRAIDVETGHDSSTLSSISSLWDSPAEQILHLVSQTVVLKVAFDSKCSLAKYYVSPPCADSNSMDTRLKPMRALPKMHSPGLQPKNLESLRLVAGNRHEVPLNQKD